MTQTGAAQNDVISAPETITERREPDHQVQDDTTMAPNETPESKKPVTVRDLANMQNGEASAAVLSALKKGDTFKVGRNRTYTVTFVSKPKRENFKDPKTGEDRYWDKSVIRIKDDKGKTISSTLLTWDDGKASFIGVNSNNRHEQLSRDIEGDISLDLINENNQFHDKTDSYKLAEKTIAVYNAPRAKRTTLLAEQQASRGSQRQKSELQYTHALVGRSRTKSRIIDMTQRKDGKYSVTVDVNGKQRKYIADESQFVADSSTEQDTPVTDDATTKTEPTDKGIKRYSTRGADRTRKTITVEQVRRAVGKGMKVTQLDNGRFQVVGQAAVRPIEVEIVDHIPIDAKAFEKAYGRKPTDEEKRRGASGVYLDGKIQISVQGDQFTIDHEFTHALIEAGVISYADARAILRSAGVDTRKVKRSNIRDYEEQIAAHIEDVRMDRAKPRTLAGRVIQKVLDFIDGLVNLVHRTARGVARDIESGKMFDRQAMGNMELRGEMYDAPRTVSPQENARYLEAVETGDMETARKMVLDAAMKAGIPILDDSASQSYRVRRTAPPKKTVKAYKLFKTKASKKDRGEIFPLFVGAKTQIPKGLWLDAIAGQETKPSKTGKRKVKSGLGPLAYRPGWHAGDLPLATHIGAKDADGNIFARKDNEVWAEVEVAADKDYQEEANSNGMTKDGRFSAALADIKHMPENGMYRYKTNPNMTGNWIISGSMKVNRILTEAEVNNLLAKKKIDPMPWKSGPLVLKKLGLNSEMANNRFKILDAVTYDDTGRPIPLSRRFDAGTTDPRYSLRGAERTKQDTIGAIKATAKAYSDSKPRRGGVVDTLLSSPEWRGGVGKLVFDKRMAWNDHRQKLFHEADIRKSDPDRSLTKDLEALKNIGIGFIGRMATNELYDIQNAKHVSPLYKEVSRVINDMDVNEIKWSKYDKTNLDPEVISIVSDYRAAMDKLWEYQYNAIGDIVKAYADKGEPMPELYKDPVTKQPVTLKDIYEKMGTLKGSYAPRIWDDGDFEVWSEDKDGQVYLNKKTTRGAAYRLAEKLEREGRKNVSFRESEKFSEELWKDIAIGPAAKLLEASAGKIDVDPDVAGAFYRSLLEEAATAFKERAFRKHRIARTMRGGKVVKGYIEDPLSRYVIYASRTAGGIAKSNAALEMFKALNGEYLKFDRKGDVWVRGDIERPTSKADRESKRKVAYLRVGGLDPKKADDRREYDMLYKYIKEQLKNPDATDRLISIGKSIISMKYLTSPKSALVNTTAIVTNAPAAIRQYATGGKAGFAEVGKALSKSGRDAIVVMRGGTLKDKDKQAFIDRIKAETIDRPQFMRDAMGAIRSAHGTAWSKVMSGALLPFSITERWNRLTTLLAGYEMAKKHNKGLSDTALQEMAIDA
ncbi:MAG: hypothetical protein RBT16_08995, partial [Desulfococcus multivorans]|nr:hypothetical protein [Desulfococcus multivorans]